MQRREEHGEEGVNVRGAGILSREEDLDDDGDVPVVPACKVVR